MSAKIIPLGAPTRLPAVILFAETRGFTRTSAILEPSVVLAQIGVFFDMVRAAVAHNNGSVHSLLNDTLMATFSGADCAQKAVQTALDVQNGFGAIEEAWARDFGIRAAVALGLHAGETVFGNAADTALVVGDCVSIASRLLHRARAGELVLSAPVLQALGANATLLEAAPLPPLTIPRREPLALHGVLRDTRLDFT